ncbi:MAG: 2Fe-2S iron-sulfur cluster-binding protein [Candidatus Binatia bacterium]
MPHTITLIQLDKQFSCAEDETILEAGLRQGFNLRHGCKHGGCGSCKARVVDGEVDMSAATSSFALLDFEREEGYLLLCSSFPLSDTTIEFDDYDEAEILSGRPEGE